MHVTNLFHIGFCQSFAIDTGLRLHRISHLVGLVAEETRRIYMSFGDAQKQ